MSGDCSRMPGPKRDHMIHLCDYKLAVLVDDAGGVTVCGHPTLVDDLPRHLIDLGTDLLHEQYDGAYPPVPDYPPETWPNP